MNERILITVPSLDRRFGGPVEKVRGLTLGLRRAGVDAVAVGCGSADWAVGLPSLGGFHGSPLPRGVRTLARLVAQADVVHIVGYRDPLGSLAMMLSARAGIPFVLEPAGMLKRKGRSIILKSAFDRSLGRMLRGAAMFVATSSLEAREIAAVGVPPARIRLRANGVDHADLLPLPARGAFRARLQVPDDVPLVLALGRIARVKNLPAVVEAVAPLDAWVAIVGPDARDGALESTRAAARRSGISDRIRIDTTGVWGGSKAEAFADADCLCLVSWSENFGNSAAEAAAIGIPAVVSNTSGVTEWLAKPARHIVSPGSVGSIREALIDALSVRGREEARGSASSIRERLDWSVLAREQAAMYSEIRSPN